MIEKKSDTVRVDNSADIERWISLARQAYTEQFYTESYRYAKMVTDSMENNVEGWFLRGNSTTDEQEAKFCANRIKALEGENSHKLSICEDNLKRFKPAPGLELQYPLISPQSP